MHNLMKILFLLFLSLNINCFADTLDVWSIHKNDSTLKKFNELSDNLDIDISVLTITKNDSISITYRDDTPCINCEFFLLAESDRDKKIMSVKIKNEGEKITMNLYELFQYKQTNKCFWIDLIYYESEIGDTSMPFTRLVTRIRFK